MDEIILKEFVAGNDAIFSFIYNKYVDVLLSYGKGLGFDKDILKDAIQDVFIKLYSNRSQLNNVQNLKSYLFRSLKNRLLDMIKMSVETSDIDNYEFRFFIKTNVLDELIEEEDKKAIQDKVEELLGCLTDRQREVIYLRFIQEMEYEDIAQLLNITTHASRKLVSRAIKKIREENMVFVIWMGIELFSFIYK